VREAARKDRSLKFTALLHHVNEDCLREAFFNLKKGAAVGVDGVSWYDYERNVEINIADLHGRIHRGAYRALPSRRVWIPKPDGRQRPLGIAALEDKIVQQAVLWVLQSIYEQDFLGFTHGCGTTRKHGRFTVHRFSVMKRLRATLQVIKASLRRRMHRPLGETRRWLRRVVQGWLNYHAVPGNSRRLRRFVDVVARMWLRVIRRRSQTGRVRWTWERMQTLIRRHLPRPRIIHPYPRIRFHDRLKAGAV
jgi:hypothetical protein